MEVKQASCANLIFSLSFFGVLASIEKTRPQSLQLPLPGTALESSVLGDKTASEGSFSGDFFLGSFFLVFPGAPRGERKKNHVVILSKFVCSYKNIWLSQRLSKM